MALYKSPHALLRINVRSGVPARPHPATGIPDPTSEIKEIVAEFGIGGNEFTVYNPETGQNETYADITGHFFDSVEAAERQGWTEEEHEAVVKIVDDWCRKSPAMVQKIERVHVAAPRPWPTFDENDPEEVVEFATKAGLVPHALRYERENAQRADVIVALEGYLEGLSEVEKQQAESVEEYPEDALAVPKMHGAPQVAAAPQFTDGGISRTLTIS